MPARAIVGPGGGLVGPGGAPIGPAAENTNMTLNQMLQVLYDRLDYESDPPTAVTRRLMGYINQTQRDTLRLKGMSALRRRILPFSTVANSPYAVMAQAMTQVFMCVDRTSNFRPIVPKDIAWIWQRDPGLQLTGPPDVFALLDYAAPVAQDPAAATELFAVSSSAADTTQNVYLEGITANGYRRQVGPILLTGVGQVSLSAAITDWTVISRWFIDSVAAGLVSLRDSSANDLGYIPPGTTYPRYTKIQLNPTPSTVSTLYAYGLIEVYDLVFGADWSIFPNDFVHLLIEGAMEREYEKREKPTLSREFAKKKKDIIADLRSYLQTPQAMKGMGMMGFSALGPWYPDKT
jgi:hypothetical protein